MSSLVQLQGRTTGALKSSSTGLDRTRSKRKQSTSSNLPLLSAISHLPKHSLSEMTRASCCLQHPPLNEKFKILGTESMSSRKTEFRSLWFSMSCIFVLIRTQLRVHPDQATTRYNLANRYHMTEVFGTKRVPVCRSDIQNQ